MSKVLPIIFHDDYSLSLLDQRLLPAQIKYMQCLKIDDVHLAIKTMVVRGAPSIGFTALYGLSLWLKSIKELNANLINEAVLFLKSARPTAVNLEFELEKAKTLILDLSSGEDAAFIIKKLADEEIIKSELKNTKMADFVAADLRKKYPGKKLNILTHCNTGFLACGSIGTALGVIERLNLSRDLGNVYVDETRPYLQGSRLTSFELATQNIDHSIVVEGAASYLMSNKLIDAIVVGADRIALNGDTANKIGTSNLSIIAHYYNIPFYVIAPKSSFDFDCPSGKQIEVEMRDDNEIHQISDHRISPVGAKGLNPSFDISEGKLITGISCEDGLLKPPFTNAIQGLLNV